MEIKFWKMNKLTEPVLRVQCWCTATHSVHCIWHVNKLHGLSDKWNQLQVALGGSGWLESWHGLSTMPDFAFH